MLFRSFNVVFLLILPIFDEAGVTQAHAMSKMNHKPCEYVILRVRSDCSVQIIVPELPSKAITRQLPFLAEKDGAPRT